MLESNGLQLQVYKLFREQMRLEIPSVDTDLLETGVLDSLTFVDLLVHLESTFGLKISVEELEIDQFRSVAKIAELVGNGSSLVRQKKAA